MKGEALARVMAEADLRKKHPAEFERLLKRDGETKAVVALVAKHSREYGVLVKEARAKAESSLGVSAEDAA